MAPPTVYRGGRKDVHFFIDFNRFKDFEELCHKEGKTVTQDLNDYIVQKKERNSIRDVGENISCLGYSPRPGPQKIDKSSTRTIIASISKTIHRTMIGESIFQKSTM